MNPHSVQKEGRTCVSCHRDSRASGLGTGNLYYNRGNWKFVAALSAEPHISGLSHPLDAFVDIEGRPLVHTSRPGLRTFNRSEIEKILYVGLCLDCHRDFNDNVMSEWKTGSPPAPCRHFIFR